MVPLSSHRYFIKGEVLGTSAETNSVQQRKSHFRESEGSLFATCLLYILPSLLLLGIFLFYPMFKTFQFSFFNVTGSGEMTEFVGWEHYKKLWASSEFRQSMKSTFLFVLYSVPTEIIIGLFFAVISSEKLRVIGFFRTIFASKIGRASCRER